MRQTPVFRLPPRWNATSSSAAAPPPCNTYSAPACVAGRFRCKVAKKRRKRVMNYSLGFPDLSRELSLSTTISPKQSLEAVVSYFRAKHLEADSAVRAIHHQPAAEGTFADMPALVDARLRAALEKRGISRLYCHQADAFAHPVRRYRRCAIGMDRSRTLPGVRYAKRSSTMPTIVNGSPLRCRVFPTAEGSPPNSRNQ